jgi:hypothetical protein
MSGAESAVGEVSDFPSPFPNFSAPSSNMLTSPHQEVFFCCGFEKGPGMVWGMGMADHLLY